MSRKKQENNEYNIDFITDCMRKKPQKLTNEQLLEAIIIYRSLIEQIMLDEVLYNENYIDLENTKEHLNELKEEMMKRLSYYNIIKGEQRND